MPDDIFTPLTRAEKAIIAIHHGNKTEGYQELKEAAQDIAGLVPNNQYLAKPLLIVAKELTKGGEDYWPSAINAAAIVQASDPFGAVGLARQAANVIFETTVRLSIHNLTTAHSPDKLRLLFNDRGGLPGGPVQPIEEAVMFPEVLPSITRHSILEKEKEGLRSQPKSKLRSFLDAEPETPQRRAAQNFARKFGL